MQDGLRQENGTAVLLVCVVSRVARPRAPGLLAWSAINI